MKFKPDGRLRFKPDRRLVLDMRTTLPDLPDLTKDDSLVLDSYVRDNRIEAIRLAKKTHGAEYYKYRFKSTSFAHLEETNRFFILFSVIAFQEDYPHQSYVFKEVTKEVSMDEWLDEFGKTRGIL